MVWWSAAGFTGKDLVEIGAPLGDCLTGPTVDEVKTNVPESRASRRRNRMTDVLRLVQPTQHAQTAPIQRLGPNAEAIYSCIEQTRAIFLVEIVWIGLDRDLGSGCQLKVGLAGD